MDATRLQVCVTCVLQCVAVCNTKMRVVMHRTCEVQCVAVCGVAVKT